VQEPLAASFYANLLGMLALPRKSWLLDIGCGSGMFCSLAARDGLVVSGIDACPALIDIARKRAPAGIFLEGDMEDLPFIDQSFDVVSGIDVFHLAASSLRALAEARRVLRPGGRVVVATLGHPGKCEIAPLLNALEKLCPVVRNDSSSPFALSQEKAMAGLVSLAGFSHLRQVEIPVTWEYPDEPTAMRGLFAHGLVSRAINHSGEPSVRQAVASAITPYVQAGGRVRLKNVFQCVIGVA
jgi:SAM-dependent methyltransferase